MAKNSVNLQDTFLNKLRRDHVFITVFLINGFQIRGMIKGFDNFTIVVEGDGKQHLIYKHAVSTVQPSKVVNFLDDVTGSKCYCSDEKCECNDVSAETEENIVNA